MKILTRFIYVVVAVMMLTACLKGLTTCATPTLTPPNGSGPPGQDIKVTIETKTLGASLSWTDDGSAPTPTNGHIITAPKGDAITVYGRTLRAMAFKTGYTDSPPVQGTYSAN
jgi:hypothetical protein